MCTYGFTGVWKERCLSICLQACFLNKGSDGSQSTCFRRFHILKIFDYIIEFLSGSQSMKGPISYSFHVPCFCCSMSLVVEVVVKLVFSGGELVCLAVPLLEWFGLVVTISVMVGSVGLKIDFSPVLFVSFLLRLSELVDLVIVLDPVIG